MKMPDGTASELYFEYYQIHVHLKGRKSHAYLSAENKPVYSQSEADWFDTASDAHKRIRRLPKGMGVFTIEYVKEYPDVPPSPGPCPDLIRQVMDEIPWPYSLTAIAWYEGRDVRENPVTEEPYSRSSYYRHRRKLLEYGIDISRNCNVHVIRYRWDQLRQR